MSSYGYQNAVVYFENTDDAERARQELLQSGIPDSAIRLESKESGGGFLEDLKRMFTGSDGESTGGAILTIDGQYAGQSCMLTIRNRGGRLAEEGVADTASAGEERRMPLHEEQLSIDKQPVQSGEAVVRKDVVTETRHVDVPVQHEEVYVEHRATSGAEAAEGAIDEDREIRIPVTREEVSVEKRAVKTGEVAVGKRTVQDTQRVDESIRKEEPRVETTGDVRTRQSSSD